MVIIKFRPFEEYNIDVVSRLVITDLVAKENILLKLIKSKSYFTVDSKDLDSNGVYKYKYQVKKYDEELGKERWMDETKHKMVYPEQINRDGMKYLLYRRKTSNKLIVIFQAVNRNPSYNYVGSLKDYNINRLYIKDDYGGDKATKSSYYLNSKENSNVADATQKLIDEVAKKLGVKKKDTIFAGSSKGGFAALYHGYIYGAGKIIPGGPQILLGNYLFSNHEDTTVGKAIFKSIFGELTEDKKQFANKLMYNALSNIKSPYPETIIHVGFWESHYLKHVVPFMEMAKELGIENVNLSIADYTTHSELAKYYPIFLQEQVNKIINDN